MEKSIDVKHLEQLKNDIESLNKFHQVEILKIFSKNLCKLNENKNGIFINMSFLPSEVIEELDKYLEYIKEQTEAIQTVEYQKEEFKNILDQDEIENIIAYSSIN